MKVDELLRALKEVKLTLFELIFFWHIAPHVVEGLPKLLAALFHLFVTTVTT
ncbi:hypothetical protein [Vibrio neptunius]|uniref:hypothetical protein n=1 Tax=Vibrio neptunius TaxID=170651 RepID=UPI001C5C91FE|nr:hypothetical protein [Vibrio neptunius]QXX09226.1 hypothetical protein KW548_19415 [Vibrio neptunius]